ncbi:MAG TPA: class I SAM-dependent methyltransferase [Burkholderiales bacterium]|nr:class I SAM-dependent methyltransferase [Burkholderiales bacterium]
MAVADPASFRDPKATVYIVRDRVFRTLDETAWRHYQQLRACGALDELERAGRIVASRAAEPGELVSPQRADARHVLEHERIPCVSYPYEWPFSLLKRAALHQLDLHLDLLARGYTLSDASAYNVQFRGTRAVFIDVPSIRPYVEGEYWDGYRQFCEQYLNPLLLTVETGIPFHAWYRGSMEGIPVDHIARLLPARSRASWRVLLHVVLHARMHARTSTERDARAAAAQRRPMAKSTLLWLLRSLRSWIASLEPRRGRTAWSSYHLCASYDAHESATKQGFVESYIRRRAPAQVLDLGCNEGAFAQLALSAGATRVIGCDFDTGALEAAVERADRHHLDFLPLFLDAANPTPEQGWAQAERRGFAARTRSDALVTLAFLHHIVIARNVPLTAALEWLTSLAPSGVIEFVPKTDPRVRTMLEGREDIFQQYDPASFRRELCRHAAIIGEQAVSPGGRVLVEYCR